MKRPDKMLNNDLGMTLIEVVASMAILAMIFLPTISIFAAAIYNNKASQDIIDTKYLAETYMEVVRGTSIAELGTELEDNHGFVDISAASDAVTTMEKSEEFVTVEWVRSTEFITIEDSGLDYASNKSIDLDDHVPSGGTSDVSFDIVITDTGTAIEVKLGSDKITYVETMLPDAVTPIGTEKYIPLYLRLTEKAKDRRVIINVTNDSGYRIRIYCTNAVYESADITFRDIRRLPEFNILNGRAAFYDYTMPADKGRLPEEDDTTPGDDMPILYDVTVKVDDREGKFYEIKTRKAVK